MEELDYVEIGNLTVGLVEARNIENDELLEEMEGSSANAPMNTSLQVMMQVDDPCKLNGYTVRKILISAKLQF